MNARSIACLVTVSCLVLPITTARTQNQAPGVATPDAQPYVPPQAPEQPLPFSHKTHVALELQCKDCHAMPGPGESATLPATGVCIKCHAQPGSSGPLQKLVAAHEKKQPIAWKRVYRLPHYVRFSHRVHLEVAGHKVTCEVCHGAVREMDVMRRVKDISMAACVNCHKTMEVALTCDMPCHAEIPG